MLYEGRGAYIKHYKVTVKMLTVQYNIALKDRETLLDLLICISGLLFFWHYPFLFGWIGW